MMMTDRELKLATMAIITYVGIIERGSSLEIGEDGEVVSNAFLDNEALEMTLALLDDADIDEARIYAVDEDEDDDD